MQVAVVRQLPAAAYLNVSGSLNGERNVKHAFVVAFVLVASIASNGCVGLSSIEGDAQGVVYYLPKTILTITVRQNIDRGRGRRWYELGNKIVGTDGTQTSQKDLIGSETVPDPVQRYTIRYNRSAFSDDRLCVARSTTGLLQDVQFVADDRTPQILFNLARIIAGTIPGGSKQAGSTQETGGGDSKIITRHYSGRVDPFDPDDITAFNTAMRNYFGEPVEIDFARMRQLLNHNHTRPQSCGWKDDCRAELQQRCGEDQICYRTKLTLPVDLMMRDRSGRRHRIETNYADIINKWGIGAISVERAFLVQKLTGLRFQNGVLGAAVIRKPSEIEELSLLPLSVVNAVLSVPTGLFAQAFGTSDDEKIAMLQRISKLEGQAQGVSKNYDNLLLSGGAEYSDANKNYTLNCGDAKSNIFGWSIKAPQ